MRHRRAGVKLNRTHSHRNAMFRNMVTSLFKHDRIRTTDAKAKELRRWADQLITLAKRGDLHARRQALSIIMEKNVVHKLFEEAQERFGSKNGGYTRLVKLGTRPGDAASITLIELISLEKKKKKAKKKEIKPEKTVEAKPEEKVDEESEAKTEPETLKAEETVEPEDEKPVETKDDVSDSTTKEKEDTETSDDASPEDRKIEKEDEKKDS